MMPYSTIVQVTSELTAKFYQHGQSSEGFCFSSVKGIEAGFLYFFVLSKRRFWEQEWKDWSFIIQAIVFINARLTAVHGDVHHQ